MPPTEGPLRVSARFSHVVRTAGHVVLVGDDDSAVVDGAAIGELFGLLDGSRRAVEIAAVLSGAHRPEIVHFALLRLMAEGLVEELGPRDQERSREGIEVPPRASATSSTASGPTASELTPSELATDVASRWAARGDASLVTVDLPGLNVPIVLTDDYLAPALHELADTDGALLCRIGALGHWIGPRVGRDSACLRCLQGRLRLNLTSRALRHLADHDPDFDVLALHPVIPDGVFAGLARTLLEAGAESIAHLDRVVVHRSDADGPTHHSLRSLPGCERCGLGSSEPPGAEVSLRSRPLRPGSKSGYRTETPDSTWERHSTLISPLTGIVRRIERVETSDPALIHAYTASHAGVYDAPSVRAVKDDTRDHSGGKGSTDLDARVSALCEAMERFSALHRGSESQRVGRRTELGEAALHPNDVLGFSERQFAVREDWNAECTDPFQWVPERYDDEAIEWSPLRSLGTGALVWVPSALVYLGHRGEARRFVRGDSNGLAGGNCLEEAVLQGLLELIERDSIALWWYNRLVRPGIDLVAVDEPFVTRVVEHYDELGRSLWALDITSDLGIPCVVALSADLTTARDITFGFGCHPDPRIALRRALTEANQVLATVLRSPQERRKQLLPDFAAAIQWWEEEELSAHRYLQPDTARSPIAVAGRAPPEPTDLLEVVEDCVGRLAAKGIDVLVHDLSRDDVRFSVARVVAPGLRHFWRRLGPGRLYDVPVAEGWLERPTAESDMNPVSLFV